MFVLFVALAFAVPLVVADGPVAGRAGRAEVRYMEGMIDHHQMALDMAEDCLTKVETESFRAVCQGVIDAQTPEIETLRGWLREWYGIEYAPMAMSELMELMDLAPDAGMEMGHGDHTANPMTDMPMMMGMMAGLDRVEGAEYEAAWLEAMVDHHDDAVHMSERILERAEHADLRALAQQIIDDQTAEIERMESMLAEYEAAG
jgi:uncharacterized protein (DUF305 family)